MPPLNTQNSTSPESGRAAFRSLDELTGTVEFREWMHREFPAGAGEMLDGPDRRQFLRIMGASFALAGLGLGGCRRWPSEEIVPATLGQAERIAGVPVEYASVFEQSGVGIGVLVKSYEGRPIKLEGNPSHPTSGGATDVFTQAAILDLYDPDRSRGVTRGGEASTLAAFMTWANGHAATLGDGAGLRVLCEATLSPSVMTMKQRLARRFPRMTWHEYESVNNDEMVGGMELAFGGGWRRELRLAQADVIVTLDADLFGAGEPDRVANLAGFAARRRYRSPQDTPTRLYSFEADLTTVGGKADERVAMRSGDIAAAAAYIAGAVLGGGEAAGLATDSGLITGRVKEVLDAAIADLQSHRGHGVLVAGSQQPAEVQYLVHLVNEALGNSDETVVYRRLSEPAIAHGRSLGELAGAIEAGSVDTLLVLGGNPVYDAPGDVDMAALLGRVTNTVHVGQYVDETAAVCSWHVNRAHPLESWGDARGWDGTPAIQQPLVEPLFGGRTPAEILAVFAGVDLDARGIAKLSFAEMRGTTEESAWRTALHDGVSGPAFPTGSPTVRRGALAQAISSLRARWEAGRGDWELVFAPHPAVGDGRWANNGWLQELPDPMTKLTWDNAAIISPGAAKELGVTDGDHLTVSIGEAWIEIPAIRLPGIPATTAILHLGFGRSFAGRIAEGAGFDVAPVRSVAGMARRGGATVSKASGRSVLATTQDHHTIDVESFAGGTLPARLKQLVRGADWNEYEKDPKFAAHAGGIHVPHRLSMWEPPKYDGNFAWGMTIDLNGCVGCNACVVACQAENNIPIVGKEQVSRGRELHWLRIDRYFEFENVGTEEEPDYDPDSMAGVMMQPMACVHCENAPCEQVCPVAATVHDHDGLNVMVYNRCIGTRYCSNNCPYKVRRFNYLDYHRREPLRDRQILEVQPDYFARRQGAPDELKQMQFNPEVTVRMRGVMEKCTYCVQRIASARIGAKNEWAREQSAAAREELAAKGITEASRQRREAPELRIPDGQIKTACEQACPAGAIVFGDLKDPGSRVSTWQRNDRSYEVLEELHVKPRTTYLATVRNPIGGGSAGHGGHGGQGGDHGGDASHSDSGTGTPGDEPAGDN
jgi:molybdopterin-containing oxidoreductase family iron-sulfur binding subunit